MSRRAGQWGDVVTAALGRTHARYTRHFRQHVADETPVGPVGGDPIPARVTVSIGDGTPVALHELLDGHDSHALAVLGGPGSGKTTLLRRLARRVARHGFKRRRIPAWLTLSRMSTAASADPTLSEMLRSQAPRLRLPEPEGWWEEQLRHGRCVVLLDGFDEIDDDRDRRGVAEWIGARIADHPGNDFVIASRPAQWRRARLADVEVASVRPLPPRAGDRPRPITSGSAVDVAPELRTHPLPASLLAAVPEEHAAPVDRVGLYRWFGETALAGHPELARRRDPSAAAVLAKLAFAMTIARTRHVDRDRAAALVGGELPVAEVGELLAAGHDAGLLECAHDEYSFVHHTVAEHFTARHASRFDTDLDGLVDDPRWGAALELSAADGANRVVDACLRRGTETAIGLAFRCAGDDLAAETTARQRLKRIEEQAFHTHADPVTRRAVAAALTARRLRRLDRLDDDTWYCPDPIPRELYWLYRQETGAAASGEARPGPAEPLGGLWPGDVRPFVAWLNAAHLRANPWAVTFRLPGEAEVPALSDRRAESPNPVWRAGASGPLLAGQIGPEELRAAVTADLTDAELVRPFMFALPLTDEAVADFAVAPGYDSQYDESDAAAPTGASHETVRRSIVSTYRRHLPGRFDWLPPDAAVFTRREPSDSGAAALGGPAARLADRLVSTAGVDAAGVGFDLGGLSTVASELADRFATGATGPGGADWSAAPVRELASECRRLCARRAAPAETWRLRLPALLLAAECAASGDDADRRRLLTIAATVTFLRRRTEPGVSENLVLVAD